MVGVNLKREQLSPVILEPFTVAYLQGNPVAGDRMVSPGRGIISLDKQT